MRGLQYIKLRIMSEGLKPWERKKSAPSKTQKTPRRVFLTKLISLLDDFGSGGRDRSLLRFVRKSLKYMYVTEANP